MKPSRLILPLLLLTAGGSMLLGLYTGLIRSGLIVPGELHLDGIMHGPLMINGFLGTLISVERAAALQKSWTFAAPVCMALATLLLLLGLPETGGYFLIAGSVLLVGILGYLFILQPVAYHVIMLIAGLALLAGNLLFIASQPIHELVIWWVAFPMLTIFGERLELNRIMRPPKHAVYLFTALIGLWIVAAIFLHWDQSLPWYLQALLLIVMAVWLIRYDVARRTIRSTGWTRYSALCLFSGYGWLILAGIYGLFSGYQIAGPAYDALLHMIFVGFVFSMIFAHAAIIFPALTGRYIPYHLYFYVPFGLLHGFLALRVIGDISWIPLLQTVGSYGNVAAILLFIAGIITQLIRSRGEVEIKAHTASN